MYFATLFVLLSVLIFGTTVRGTSGWIGLGAFRIQPVEISKIALIIFLASFISQKRMELGETGRLVASFILTSIMLILVIKQPDFGSSMVLLSIWVGMTLVSGISRKLMLTIVFFAAIFSFVGWFQLAPYQKDRIMSFVDPTRDPMGAGYNVKQSIVAVGSGGLTGKGIGHGSQSQLNFLPEKHTDFIFASIAEELGFLGSTFVIALFGTVFYRIRRIAQTAPDNFGYLVAVGVLVMFFVQSFINIGMNMGIVPVTGIPLPFLSYGGSSLISVFAAVGILLNIYSRRESAIKTEY
ncbi:MAG TPA: rod shape-determining protein RodA [Candidatus Moranbacteria bacterium]|nr:rod shape-determining protein RodA [Candidatus Moranbacteria bacterium]